MQNNPSVHFMIVLLLYFVIVVCSRSDIFSSSVSVVFTICILYLLYSTVFPLFIVLQTNEIFQIAKNLKINKKFKIVYKSVANDFQGSHNSKV